MLPNPTSRPGHWTRAEGGSYVSFVCHRSHVVWRLLPLQWHQSLFEQRHARAVRGIERCAVAGSHGGRVGRHAYCWWREYDARSEAETRRAGGNWIPCNCVADNSRFLECGGPGPAHERYSEFRKEPGPGRRRAGRHRRRVRLQGAGQRFLIEGGCQLRNGLAPTLKLVVAGNNTSNETSILDWCWLTRVVCRAGLGGKPGSCRPSVHRRGTASVAARLPRMGVFELGTRYDVRGGHIFGFGTREFR